MELCGNTIYFIFILYLIYMIFNGKKYNKSLEQIFRDIIYTLYGSPENYFKKNIRSWACDVIKRLLIVISAFFLLNYFHIKIGYRLAENLFK